MTFRRIKTTTYGGDGRILSEEKGEENPNNRSVTYDSKGNVISEDKAE
jgi:hypothetical protein